MVHFSSLGSLVNQDGNGILHDPCRAFDSYCFTATIMLQRNMFAEESHVHDKAFALLTDVMQTEHPRTLVCFFGVMINLIQA
jgi:hypothetical protein